MVFILLRQNLIAAFFAYLLFAPLVFAHEDSSLIREIDQRFRSSDRYIPAHVLQVQAVRALGPTYLEKLAGMSQRKLIGLLKSALISDPGIKLNQGVVENLIKIQHMAKLSSSYMPVSDGAGDNVVGLEQSKLDELVSEFPIPDSALRRNDEFNFREYEFQSLAIRDILNNDLYNFKMAAGYFVAGKHLTHEATFSLFSRGNKNRAYIITAGQDMVADMLMNLRFTEREIQYLKSNPEFRSVPAEFFDYLRVFRFTGSVRAMPVGTVAFANEPILEITGNPVEAQIVETLVIPIINGMSHFASKTARVVSAASGRPVVEGGSRRGIDGMMSAVAAYLGGAVGTSNATIARIFGIPAYGSQSHSGVTIEQSELDAHINYHRLFPKSSLLGDTYDILNGVKVAIRAAGKDLKGVRIDSTIPGMDKAQTATAVRSLLDSIGYQAVQITLSDGLDEYQLAELPAEKAPFEFALVGTEIAAPSDAGGLNVVYKLEQVKLANGEVRDPIKTSTGKVSWPGEKQVIRYQSSDGTYDHDVIIEYGEPIPAGATALLESLVSGGKRVGVRESLQKQRARIQANIKKLPQWLLEAGIKIPMTAVKPYAVEISSKLHERQSRAKAIVIPKSSRKVGVYFGSFDPVTEAHVLLVNGMKHLYNLDEVIVVPTGDDPVLAENKKYLFTAKQRAAMLKRAFQGEQGISISMLQVEGRVRFSLETLLEIERTLPREHEVYVLGGEDLLTTLPSWRGAAELVARYNWAIADRGGSGKIELPSELVGSFRVRDKRHLVSSEGRVIELVHLPKVKPNVSSGRTRKRFNRVEAIFHQVDAQKTFWENNHGEGDGPLAVKGTSDILENVQKLARLAHQSPRIKAVSSKDRHHMVEANDPKINAEFHPSPDGSFIGFPLHGMADMEGPVGDARIPEVEDVFPVEKKLVIPHHAPVEKGLELVNVDLDAVSDSILDPEVELVIEKNGMNSTDVFQNPRTIEIYSRLNPEKSKPVYLYGVATDVCDRDAVLGLRRAGYEVFVIRDAIRGVFPEATDKALKEMEDAGAKFTTTAEVLGLFRPTCQDLLTDARATRIP